MKTLAIIAIGLGLVISISNWATIYLSWRTKKFVSSVPIFGALFLGLGLAFFEKTRYYALLCLIADYGTLVLIISIPRMVREEWKTCNFNLIQTFVGESKHTKYVLKLYRKGVFVIKAEVKPPQPTNEYGAQLLMFGFLGKWEDNKGSIELKGYDGNREIKLTKTNGKYLVKETNYPVDREYKYDLLNGVEFVLLSKKQPRLSTFRINSGGKPKTKPKNTRPA